MKEMTAGGGVLFRKGANEPEVLLIFRRGVWDLPKGKKEAGESSRECAMREVSEEVGCGLPQIHAELAETYHEYIEEGEQIGKHTRWYAMSAPDNTETLAPQREEGIERLQWFELSEAKRRVGYPNLLKVLANFEQWYHLVA